MEHTARGTWRYSSWVRSTEVNVPRLALTEGTGQGDVLRLEATVDARCDVVAAGGGQGEDRATQGAR